MIFESDQKHPLYIQIYNHYKKLIESEKIGRGERMPSIRRCACELSVSRTTAEAAYFQLAADGYIIARPQSGYYVTDFARNRYRQMLLVKAENRAKIKYDFASFGADSESFDFALWSRYIKSALRESDRLLSYGEPQGERDLREVLCEYLSKSRGTVCTADDIVIGAGVQSLLQILCPMVAAKTVSFMGRNFPQGRLIFENYGYKVSDSGEVIYVMPSSDYGKIMQVEERLALLRSAGSDNRLIIEDDYESEFRYFAHPTPSIQGLSGGENVVYIGTFSKLLLPSIRLSYMILPPDLSAVYTKRRDLYNQTASKTEQMALCRFIRDGHLQSRIRRVRRLYSKRASEMCDKISLVFGDKAEASICDSGFYIRLKVYGLSDIKDCVARAKEKGILLRDNGKDSIFLSVSAVGRYDFDNAFGELKKILLN